MSSSPKRPSKPSKPEPSSQAHPPDPSEQSSSDALAQEQPPAVNAPTTVETPSDQHSEMTSELASTVHATELTPPNRPKPPAAPSSAAPVSKDQDEGEELSHQASVAMRQQPIPPPSEPMQYRAIGLIRGRYTASADQFTQGTLTTSDGTEVDAVLLGRIMSLVKKHLDLEQEHLWVVYPRTRAKEDTLHAQIVGVWEPEKLGRAEEDTPSEETTASADQADSTLAEGMGDGYFSIRGEVIYQSLEEEHLIVKIQQSARKEGEPEKSFKLHLNGALAGKAVGHFWDLQVDRQGLNLVIREGQSIGLLPPRKRQAGERRRSGPPRKGPGRPPQRPGATGGRSGEPAPAPRKAPLPKPVKRKDTPEASE